MVAIHLRESSIIWRPEVHVGARDVTDACIVSSAHWHIAPGNRRQIDSFEFTPPPCASSAARSDVREVILVNHRANIPWRRVGERIPPQQTQDFRRAQ